MRSCVASCSTLARRVPSSRSSELRRSLSSVVIALWMRAASRSADPTSSSARRCAASSVLSASDDAVVRTSSASRRAVAMSSATSFSARARSWPDDSFARASASAAWEFAWVTTSEDCSSAERSSCSMREPSPE